MKKIISSFNNITILVVSLLIITCMFWMMPHRTYSGFVTDWIKDKINSHVSTMSDEMLSGIGQRTTQTVESLGEDLIKDMVQGLGPDLTAFENFVSGNRVFSGSETLRTDNASKFADVAQVFGYSLAMVILTISLLKFFVAKPDELRDTPMRLLVRFFFAMLMIYFSRDIMNAILKMANDIWQNYIMSTEILGNRVVLTYDDLVPLSQTEEGQIAMGFMTGGAFLQLCASPDGGVIGTFLALIALLINWPLIKGFVKLYIEVIERYLVIVLLYYFFGAAAATYASKETSNVFRSYMNMIASQIFVLFVNSVFMSLFVDIAMSHGFTKSIPNYVMGIAYLQICMKIDQYMAMLGLNVAQTGGQTLDALLGAGRGIASGFRDLGRAASNGAKVGSSYAEKAGNFQTAAVLKGLSGINGAAEVIGNGGVNDSARLMAAKRGVRYAATPEQSAAMIQDFMSDPTNKKAQMLSAYDDNSLIAGLNKLAHDNGMDLNVSSIDRSLMRAGRLGFTGTAGSGENKQEISGTLSSREIPQKSNVKTNSGYLSFNNKIKENPNVIHKGNAESLGAASGYGELLNKAPYKDKIAGMSYDAKTGYHNLYDKDGNKLGAIANINGKDRLVNPSYDKDKAAKGTDEQREASLEAAGIFGRSSKDGQNAEMAAEAKQRIMDQMHFKTLKMGKYDKEKGVAYATATMEDPFGGDDKKVNVRMSDLAVNEKSKNGTVCDIDGKHFLDVQTAPISENKKTTQASNSGQGGNSGNGRATNPEGNASGRGGNGGNGRATNPEGNGSGRNGNGGNGRATNPEGNSSRQGGNNGNGRATNPEGNSSRQGGNGGNGRATNPEGNGSRQGGNNGNGRATNPEGNGSRRSGNSGNGRATNPESNGSGRSGNSGNGRATNPESNGSGRAGNGSNRRTTAPEGNSSGQGSNGGNGRTVNPEGNESGKSGNSRNGRTTGSDDDDSGQGGNRHTVNPEGNGSERGGNDRNRRTANPKGNGPEYGSNGRNGHTTNSDDVHTKKEADKRDAETEEIIRHRQWEKKNKRSNNDENTII